MKLELYSLFKSIIQYLNLNTFYGFSSEGEMFPVGSHKWEKCLQSAPINGSSDGTYKVAFAITQFASGSKSTSVLIMQS